VIATFVGLLLPVFAPHGNHALGRRLFWIGLIIAVASAFFIAFPPDWRAGAEISGFVAFMMLGTAYFTSPYLKFRGKIQAAFTMDVEAEDPARNTRIRSRRGSVGVDGLLMSAQKLWWFMVPAMALCTFNSGKSLVAQENPRLAVVMAATVVVLAGGFGFVDGSTGDQIARKQTLQFVVVSLVTLGIFPLLYLCAYAAGRQKLRRDDSSGP
jgi:hypothetical protein